MTKQRWLYAFCFLFFTVALVEGVFLFKMTRKQQPQSLWDRAKNEMFPSSALAQKLLEEDPFESFLKERESLFGKNDSWFGDRDSWFKSRFGKWPRNTLTSSLTLSGPRRVDQGDEVKLLFSTQGHEKANYAVNIEGGQITITGKDEKESSEDDSFVQKSHWNFTQSFPAPNDVDLNQYRVERKDDELAVIFKKRKEAS